MKKVLLTISAVALASSVFAQGTVVFNNRVAGSVFTRVYLGGTDQRAGNGATDTPVGTTDWTGFTQLIGAGYSAALLAAPGANAEASALVYQAGSLTTFRTGTAAGQIAPLTVTLSNVAGDAPAATFQMVAWDNKGGTIGSWSAALADPQGVLGRSPLFTVNAIGGAFNTPPNLTGLQSFNIFPVPEPSTFALAGLGAAAMLIFRRRK